MKMRSLRGRLMFTVALGTAALLIVANAAVYLGFRGMLHRAVDRTLESYAATLATMVEAEHGRLVFENEQDEWPSFLRRRQASVRVVGEDGQELFRSGPMPPLPPPDRMRRFAVLPGPEPMKVLREAVVVPPVHGEVVQLIVGMGIGQVEHQLSLLAWVLAAVTAAASLSAAALAWGAVRVGLRPVEQLAEQIRGLTPDELDQRVGTADLPTELAPVAERLNGLLDRVQRAVERERGFTADVAHELRTPLAGLRTTAEVALQQDRPADAYRRSLEKTLGMTTGLQDLVERLLVLARLDAERAPMQMETVPLRPLVQRTLEGQIEALNASDRAVDVRVPQEATWHADGALSQVIVQNLLDNAVAHGDPGTPVSVTASSDGGAVWTLAVTNAAGALTEADVPHLFDRFWRRSEAREAGGHAGLGLALVQRAAQLQHGHAQASLDDGALTVSVELPRGETA